MRRNSSVLIALATAALTFGSLYAFVGAPRFTQRGYYNRAGYYNCDQRPRSNAEGNNRQVQPAPDSIK